MADVKLNDQELELQERELYGALTTQAAPVYISDSIDTLISIGNNACAAYLENVHGALTRGGAHVFREKVENSAPVILLTKSVSSQAKDVCRILKKAGVTVFLQDARSPFKVITSTDAEQIKKELLEQYQDNFSAGGTISDFDNIIESSANTPAIKTGFPILDKVLDGGLYEGLYAIGAISSLGKTTFCLNIAEQIAEKRQDVIIISLEMGKYQLISRSISRLTFMKYQEDPQAVKYEWCKTSRGITDGSRYSGYIDPEKDLIDTCKKEYAESAGKHLYIHEAIGNLSASDIRDIVIRHKEFTGNRPVVIIDYLQLIQHEDKYINGNDKIRTDFNLTALKQLSRDKHIPILVISSFNRAGYNTEVKLECFKESGGIDYSCDVIMGLQLSGVGTADFDVNEAKAKNPREIELVFLKNRDAAMGDLIKYYYYPMFNHFEESEEDPRAEREYKKQQEREAKQADKKNKAEQQQAERAEMVRTAYQACEENGSALISEMVEFCGGTPKAKTMERYIKETGDYTIYGNKVIKNH